MTAKKKTEAAGSGANPMAQSGSLKRGLGALKSTIEDLAHSLREIQGPLTDTRENLPKATTHLDRISSQTEQAAHRVMDMVENISAQQVEIIKHLNEALNSLADTKEDSSTIVGLLESAEEIANRSQNDAFTIMDALQFQDITTQQINHAASLLEDVDDKIAEILGDYDGLVGDSDKQAKSAEKKKRKDRAFDPHADMEIKHTDQAGIDNLIKMSNETKR